MAKSYAGQIIGRRNAGVEFGGARRYVSATKF